MSRARLNADRRMAGLYIVSLTNDVPISVNANDQRVSSKCISVTRLNCKFGKSVDLARRSRSYSRVFGASNLTFVPIAEVEELRRAERAVLAELDAFRLRGQTRRKNEWLAGITPREVLNVVFSTLDKEGIPYRRLPTAILLSDEDVSTLPG